MIIFKKTPFNCQMKNMILLDDKLVNGCVYVNKETYDQALAISIIYNNDQSRLENIIAGSNSTWRNNTALVAAVNEAVQKLPEPLNMLSIFLVYANNDMIDWDIVDDEELANQIYGTLHMLSQFVDFYAMTTVPAEIRSKLNIPTNILKGYNESWNALTATLEDFRVAVPAKEVVVTQPVQSTVKVTEAQVTPAPTVTPVQQTITQQVAEDTTSVNTAPAPVASEAQKEESDEDEEEKRLQEMYDRMQAMFKEVDETPPEVLAEKQGKKVGSFGSSETTTEQPKEKIPMTEDIKKEKEIAEESVKVINSYDI